MRDSTGHSARRPASGPSTAPGLQLGSRPSTTGMLHLALGDVPERDRPSRLNEFFAPLGECYDAERIGEYPINVDVTLLGLPGIQLLSGQLQGARYRRIRQSNDPTDDVGLIMNPRGRLLIGQRGREMALDDGDAVLVSLTEPLELMHRAPGDLLVVRCPRPQIASRLAGQDCFMRGIAQGSPALGLLTDYAKVACAKQTLADIVLQQRVVSHLYDLMAVTMGATRDAMHVAQGGGLHAARLHALKQDITTQLGAPGLSIAALASRHGCTERFIQRLFESEGTTFTEYVLTQRLAQARQMLSDPRRDDAKISAIAYECGFSDVSYFNRVFRRAFDVTPSDMRAEGRSAARHRNADA